MHTIIVFFRILKNFFAVPQNFRKCQNFTIPDNQQHAMEIGLMCTILKTRHMVVYWLDTTLFAGQSFLKSPEKVMVFPQIIADSLWRKGRRPSELLWIPWFIQLCHNYEWKYNETESLDTFLFPNFQSVIGPIWTRRSPPGSAPARWDELTLWGPG